MKKHNWILLLAILIGLQSFGQKIDKKSLKDGIYAYFITNKGNILVNLEYEKVPMTVANFVGLAEGKFEPFDTIEIKNPFYDGTKFHRVIANFVIQGGDPTGTGNGGPGYAFYDEFHDSLTHDAAGVLAMANSGKNTNGSQFYITRKALHRLDGGYSIFGKVVSGLAIVDSIQQNDTLQHVEIIRKGRDARKFKATEEFRGKYEAITAILKAEKERIMKIKKMSIPEYKTYFKEEMSKAYPDAMQTESGLMIIIEEQGEGSKPAVGQNVSVHYTGKFLDGKKFDSSKDRNKPIIFPLGQGRVIKGWDEGIGMLGKGGKATLIIPYYLAYGPKGRAVIPPYATLIFDVELVDY